MSSCNIIFTMKRNGISSMHLCLLVILVCFVSSNAVHSDIECLKSVKNTLEDPENLLSSWDFNNSTEGFICEFVGIECWHPLDSRVLNIHLSDMGLKGPFPMGLKNCTSLTGLDLSRNHLTGPIPTNLSDVVGFLTSLDLSNNSLSGPIPPSIGNCSSLNVIRLNNNYLTGQIPPELGELHRIKEFSVANNRLVGQIPNLSNHTFTRYANNLELCGGPLDPCEEEGHENLFLSGFEVGFPASTVLTMLLMYYCLPTLSMSNMSLYHMIKKIKGIRNHLIPGTPLILLAENFSSEESKVTAMQKFTHPLSLVELETATNNFDNKKVIGHGYMGLMYKAMFPNGLLLAVKRLHKFESFEKEFLLEIEILGRLRHTNLVPLLGFCHEREKKFLVYKYMCNGTLNQWLYPNFNSLVEGKKMGWTLRFKIAIGIARGLAWLHYNNIVRVAHRKISSKCILLDDKFQPKISNFGNSYILMNTSGIPSSVCNFVVPDSSPYKEDVYSFGILLLELVTGREPSTWINSPTVHVCELGKGFDDEIRETLKIAERCIRAQTGGEISMRQVYQAMCAIGTSSNEISVDVCMNIEDN